jgi:hypothetical protein
MFGMDVGEVPTTRATFTLHESLSSDIMHAGLVFEVLKTADIIRQYSPRELPPLGRAFVVAGNLGAPDRFRTLEARGALRLSAVVDGFQHWRWTTLGEAIFEEIGYYGEVAQASL